MEKDIHLFDKADDLKIYKSGDTIFKTGDERKYMYVVVSGEVDLLIDGHIVETVKPSGFFGEMALIEKEPRIATAVARTDCELAAVDENRFNFMVHETPFFALKVMRVLAQRLRRMDYRLSGIVDPS